MLTFLAQYWLTFLFGLITTGLAIACKKIYSLYKSEKAHQKTKEQKEFYNSLEDLIDKGRKESLDGDKVLKEDIEVLKSGLLSIQKRHFKQQCYELLKDGHKITLEEFQALMEDHDIYNALGGNHDGDTLFEMVRKKATYNITDLEKKKTGV